MGVIAGHAFFCREIENSESVAYNCLIEMSGEEKSR